MPKQLKIKKISNLVSRVDYSAIDTSFFEQPNLLETQKNSYERFFKKEIEKLVNLYFPVRHEKNDLYEVQFKPKGIRLVEQEGFLNENQAIEKGKTYEKALFIELVLVNNETGETDEAPAGKKKIAPGIFFGNIPMITEKGTFIVNGIEKNVISQIVRAPGLYALTKTKSKLSSKKKDGNENICEVLPLKGNLLNFYIDDNGAFHCSIRNSAHDANLEFSVTEVLKALGMSESNITSAFANNEIIVKSISNDLFNRTNVFKTKIYSDFQYDVIKHHEFNGSPLDKRIFNLIKEYETSGANNAAKTKILDEIITEITAKQLITRLKFSTKTIENN
jgi:DNA-directed RNA polymerase subunit beta